MPDRYFVDKPLAGDHAQLTGDESKHLAQVMRAKLGDEVLLFDGQGIEARATIERISKQNVELTIVSKETLAQEFASRLTLAVALPKGDRQKWLVEKLVELGCDALLPLETDRGVAQPVDSAIERLRRGVIEASKQSGRSYLMEILPPLKCDELFAAGASGESLRLMAHPGGESLAKVWNDQHGDVMIAIGPEGGFSDREVALAEQAGVKKVSLGPTILRIETAAIAAAAYRLLMKSRDA